MLDLAHLNVFICPQVFTVCLRFKHDIGIETQIEFKHIKSHNDKNAKLPFYDYRHLGAILVMSM